MNLITNIVLVNGDITTQPYVLQLEPEDSSVDFTFQYDGNIACLFETQYDHHLLKSNNDWYSFDSTSENEYTVKKATVKLYLPQYSVNTFNPKTKYILYLCVYINGKEVELGNFLFERTQALACSPKRFSGMDEYYECVQFTIANPYTLIYENSQIQSALGQSQDYIPSSLLHACLFVVNESDDTYIKDNEWNGGQNSILISDPIDLSSHVDYDVEERSITLNLSYNGDDIEDYFTKYYDCVPTATAQYVIMDEDNIYYEQSLNNEELSDTYSFSIDEQNNSLLDNTNIFSDWSGWKEGLWIKASISFFNNEDEPFMTLFSNKMILTKDLFAKMVQSSGYDDIRKINLDDLDMNNINLTAFNQIVQEINTVDVKDSTKSHLIQPVFYQTRELGNTIIHPTVTENIAINLDSYKSQVKTFKVKIENTSFNEVGRTSKGIIFTIYGNMLLKEVNEGTLFILNENDELVTTGKYTYSF